MGNELIWDNEQKTIIRWKLPATLEPHILNQQHEQLRRIMHSISHYVDVIVHFDDIYFQPNEEILQIIFSDELVIRSNGLFMLVACQPDIQAAIQVWLRSHPRFSQIIAFVDTLDEARSALTDPDDIAQSTHENYELYWHIPGSVAYLKMEADISLENMEELSTNIEHMLSSADSTVNILWDFSGVDKLDIRPQPMRNALGFLTHPQLGWVITIEANRFIQFLISVVFQLASARTKGVATFDEAISFIKNELKQSI
jgi:hypothetical protein